MRHRLLVLDGIQVLSFISSNYLQYHVNSCLSMIDKHNRVVRHQALRGLKLFMLTIYRSSNTLVPKKKPNKGIFNFACTVS